MGRADRQRPRCFLDELTSCACEPRLLQVCDFKEKDPASLAALLGIEERSLARTLLQLLLPATTGETR